MMRFTSNATTTTGAGASAFISITFRVGPRSDDDPTAAGSRSPQHPPFDPEGDVIEAEFTVGKKDRILAAGGATPCR